MKRIADYDDYVMGVTDAAQAAAFEEEMFADPDEGALVFVDRFANASRWFAQRGGFVGGATRAQIEELRTAVPTTFYFEINTGEKVLVQEWPKATPVVAYRVGVDLRGYDEADVVVVREDGTPVKTFRDVQWDPSDGALYAVCDEPLARASFLGGPFRARVEATRNGNREVVAHFHVAPARV